VAKVDLSQFYPSLYTHAVGWAIDPKLRKRAHSGSRNLLGKALDQNLMNLQGKISQGVPIGNDVSFLLTEIVLAQIDRKLRVTPSRAYRWIDDYEIACDSREEAEEILARLNLGLGAFRLRVNPIKTRIVPYRFHGSKNGSRFSGSKAKQTSTLRKTWFSILIQPLDSVTNTPNHLFYFMRLASYSSCAAQTLVQARWL
jgi:hypothetical protein